MSKKKKILVVSATLMGVILGVLAIYVYRSPTLSLFWRNWTEGDQTAKIDKKDIQNVDKALVLDALKKGKSFLIENQAKGVWEKGHPGITALSLLALQKSPFRDESEIQTLVDQSLTYLLGLQQSDGSFYIPFSVSSAMNNYNTALAIMALSANKDKKYEEAIKKAQDYLISIQNTGSEDKVSEGGVSYGGEGGGDLSNLQLTLEALKESGLDEDHEFFQRAKTFITRCQDSEANDQDWSEYSGGFIYKPTGLNDEGKAEPYGAMTFAGLKSLLFCNVPATDQRIVDSMKWIRANFSVEEHPGKGQVSLFYYYYSLSKALVVADIKEITLDSGEVINWKKILAKELISRQKEDGSWTNPTSKYLEGIDSLSSAYAMNALNLVYEHWDE